MTELPIWIDRILSHRSMRSSFFESMTAHESDAITNMCKSVKDGDSVGAQVAEGRRQMCEDLKRQVEMHEREEKAQKARDEKGGGK